MFDTRAAAKLAPVGPYDLLEALPSSGTAEAFVARRVGTSKLVILKRLHPKSVGGKAVQSRFARESEVAMHLDHPNLIVGLDHGQEGNVLYLATELVLGCSLRALLAALQKANEPLPLAHFATIAESILKGLHYAHEATDSAGRPLGIIHRDLSPDHVLLTPDGDVRIQDFALARARTGEFKTVMGMAVGTAAYLSPEQARGYPLDRRSDLYTLGVTFYEMLAGRPVVDTKVLVEAIRMVTDRNVAALRPQRGDVPSKLDAVIRTATAKSARDRYKTAEEMREALRSALSQVEPDPAALGAFVRTVLPKEGARVKGILERADKKAERLPKRTYEEEATTRIDLASEPKAGGPRAPAKEDADRGVSVFSAGAPAPDPEAPASDGSPLASRRSATGRRASVAGLLRRGLIAVAVLVLAVGAAYVVSRLLPPPTPTAQNRGSAEAPREASADSSGEKAAARPPNEDVREVLSVESRPLPEGARPPRGTKSASPAPAPVEPEAREPTPTPKSRDPLHERLAALRADPDDQVAFARLHAALYARARRLPAEARAPIVADLEAAERNADVEGLARALERLPDIPVTRPRPPMR